MDNSSATEKAITSRWVSDPLAYAQSCEKGSRSMFSNLLIAAYRVVRLRSICLRLCSKFENGTFYSKTLRDILWCYHGVRIGNYTYGPVLQPGVLPPGSCIGAYCSVGPELIVRRRNHPTERPIQHAFFYNRNLGFLTEDTIHDDSDNPLTIGHDVWIGDRVIILPGCRKIGNGAVLAAGAVVSRDVAAYAIVGGVPAKVINMRFDEAVITVAEASRWWELSIQQLLQHRNLLLQPHSAETFTKLMKLHEQNDTSKINI